MNLDLRNIPAVYMNLKRHTEKNENMQSLLNECGFKNIIRVEGVDRPDNTVAGCSSAHYGGLCELDPPFVLFEDDCVIKNFYPNIEIPDNADAIYLGVSSWGRINGHSGPFLEYENYNDTLYQVYNMLGGHAILYLSEDYVNMCKRIAYHAGYVIEDYQDIGFAEIQRWFNVYAFNDPMFYQTSAKDATINKLIEYQTQECFSYMKPYFLPARIKK